MKYCRYCGEKLRDESRFCYRCGLPCDREEERSGSLTEEVPSSGAENAAEETAVSSAEIYSETMMEENPDPVIEDAPDPAAEENPEPFSEESPESSSGAVSQETDHDSGSISDQDVQDEEPLREDDDSFLDDDWLSLDDSFEEDSEDPVYEDRYEMVPSLKPKKSGRTWGIVILVIAGALAAYLIWSPGRRALSSAAAGKTAEARTIYEKEVSGKPTEEIFLMLTAPFGMDRVFSSYNHGNIYYEEASAIISTLGEIGKGESASARRLNQLSTLYDSKVAFLAGDHAREKGDARTALLNYRKVVREDLNYRTAMDLADQMKDQFISEVTGNTDSLSSDEEYRNAIAVLEDAAAVLPDDQTVKDTLSKVRQSYASDLKSHAVSTGSEYIEEGHYKEAIDLINDALSYNPQDADLITLRNTAEQKYEDFVSSQYKIYMDNKDLEGAGKLLDRAAKDLPDSQEIAELYESFRK